MASNTHVCAGIYIEAGSALRKVDRELRILESRTTLQSQEPQTFPRLGRALHLRLDGGGGGGGGGEGGAVGGPEAADTIGAGGGLAKTGGGLKMAGGGLGVANSGIGRAPAGTGCTIGGTSIGAGTGAGSGAGSSRGAGAGAGARAKTGTMGSSAAASTSERVSAFASQVCDHCYCS